MTTPLGERRAALRRVSRRGVGRAWGQAAGAALNASSLRNRAWQQRVTHNANENRANVQNNASNVYCNFARTGSDVQKPLNPLVT